MSVKVTENEIAMESETAAGNEDVSEDEGVDESEGEGGCAMGEMEKTRGRMQVWVWL